MVIEYQTSINVSAEDIDDICCSALEGGITYWCDRCDVVEDYLGKYASDQISRGGKLRLRTMEPWDDEDTEWYELDQDKLLKGLKMYLMDPNKPYGIITMDDENDKWVIDTGMVDAVVADMIVQYALFNEIIYG